MNAKLIFKDPKQTPIYEQVELGFKPGNPNPGPPDEFHYMLPKPIGVTSDIRQFKYSHLDPERDLLIYKEV
jgi:hypothetical protein